MPTNDRSSGENLLCHHHAQNRRSCQCCRNTSPPKQVAAASYPPRAPENHAGADPSEPRGNRPPHRRPRQTPRRWSIADSGSDSLRPAEVDVTMPDPLACPPVAGAARPSFSSPRTAVPAASRRRRFGVRRSSLDRHVDWKRRTAPWPPSRSPGG
jgi:hypothetical protein